MRQGVAGDLGESSGQFDSGGTAADDHEVERSGGFAGGSLPLRQFEGEQHAPADFERIFDRLEAGSEGLPIIVPKIGVARARGDDQVVVRDFSIGSFDDAALKIEVP